MLIRKIHFPVTTLGPGERIGIWTQGCNKRCHNCIEPKLWDFDHSYDVTLESVVKTCQNIVVKNPNIGITISGGDPFLQVELIELLRQLKNLNISDILVYTGYLYEEIIDSSKAEALEYIDVLIDGPYVDELNDNKPLRGSSNQRIIFLNKDVMKRYKTCLEKTRTYQVVFDKDNKFSILGIVPKGFSESLKKHLK